MSKKVISTHVELLEEELEAFGRLSSSLSRCR